MKLGLMMTAMFALAGCGALPPADHYTVYIDPAFGSDQSAAIVEGLQEWERAVGVKFDIAMVKVELDKSYYNSISFHPSTYQEINEITPGSAYIGLTEYEKDSWNHVYNYSNVLLDYKLDDATFAWAVRHEVGHALGLNHIGAGNLMCKNMACASRHVQCADQSEYYQLRNVHKFFCTPPITD